MTVTWFDPDLYSNGLIYLELSCEVFGGLTVNPESSVPPVFLLQHRWLCCVQAHSAYADLSAECIMDFLFH